MNRELIFTEDVFMNCKILRVRPRAQPSWHSRGAIWHSRGALAIFFLLEA